MTLDVKQPEGRALLLKLVAQADVIVENYRLDVKHRPRIAYENLRAVNPRLVYAPISGYG